MKKIDCFKEDVYAVEKQLKFAHKNGHDVQLHIHPWWFDAKYENGKWQFGNNIMSLSDLEADDALSKLLLCKNYLTELLTTTEIDYSCIAYRAGSWSMMPTENIFYALTMAGIKVDSSVYKWGKLDTDLMKYDYTDAYSNIHPWFFSEEDVNKVANEKSNKSKCLEIPIYTEKKTGISFVTLKRLLLQRKVKSVVIDRSSQNNRKKLKKNLLKRFEVLFKKLPKKLDFCKCSFGEMKNMIENIVIQNPTDGYLPVVSIGHSKDFIYWKDLKNILAYLKSRYSDIIEVVSLTTASTKYLDEHIKLNSKEHHKVM